ncbi:hypothetical protein [Spirosoma arcticum]
MKTTAQLTVNALMVSLLLTTAMSGALAASAEPGDPVAKVTSFEVNTYLGPQWKLNLMMDISRPVRITIIIRNSDNTVLYREIVSRGSRGYWRRFDFEGSEPGVYVVEVSDGRQMITRRIEIVDIPAIDSQRYIVHIPTDKRL